MITIRTRTLAAALAFSLPAQTLLVQRPSAALAPAPACNSITLPIAPMVVSHTALSPAVLVPLTALSPDEQRHIIAGQLIELGRDNAAAQQMAGELTPDDLAVLLANPKMMQKAGAIDVVIWALIIAGVVVAIVVAAEGTIVVNA